MVQGRARPTCCRRERGRCWKSAEARCENDTLTPLGKGFTEWFTVISMSTPASLAARDARHHLHPFTNHDEMHAAGTHVMVRGEGAYIWDARGHKMLDGLAGLWCVNVGYSCHEITDAVTAQMRQLPYYCSFF